MLQIRWLIVTLNDKGDHVDAFASEIQSDSAQIQLVPFQAKYQVTRNGSKLLRINFFRLSHSKPFLIITQKSVDFFDR